MVGTPGTSQITRTGHENGRGVVGNGTGEVVLGRRMRRNGLCDSDILITAVHRAMEACSGAPYLGRRFVTQDHSIWLMSLEYVRPYLRPHIPCERLMKIDAYWLSPAHAGGLEFESSRL
jgi:hypothetical protein